MHKCIICGGDTPDETIIGDTVFHLCYNRKCQGIFAFKTLGSFPIVWLCPNDVWEEERVSDKVYEYFDKNPDKFVGIAQNNGDDLWDNGFGDMFREVKKRTAEHMQEDYVLDTPFKQLPLIINELKTDRAKKLYRERFEAGE